MEVQPSSLVCAAHAENEKKKQFYTFSRCKFDFSCASHILGLMACKIDVSFEITLKDEMQEKNNRY